MDGAAWKADTLRQHIGKIELNWRMLAGNGKSKGPLISRLNIHWVAILSAVRRQVRGSCCNFPTRRSSARPPSFKVTFVDRGQATDD